MEPSKTINMLIAALGGEGGGVLTNWLIEAADRSGWHCQSTSLAGVAQRTGATIYYLEFMPREENQPAPVMSLFPAQGDIDLAVTSELAEAGRMISRGFISPDRTTLISSDHRVYGITEKSHGGDGAIDSALLLEMASRYAERFIHFDVAELVQRHGTVISAGLLGAIAGSGALPFDQATFRGLLAAGGDGNANTAAFDEARERAAGGGVALFEPKGDAPFTLPLPTSAAGEALMPQIAALPASVHEVVFHGANRLIDYQDVDYAREYLSRVTTISGLDTQADASLTRETARYLALWMAFEDIPRVAQLKVRSGREAMIREEVRAAPDQPLLVSEYFHPRVEEIAAVLPARLGSWLLRAGWARKALSRLLGPRTLRTDGVLIQGVLRVLASLRVFRRGSLGYAHEWQMIDRWFEAIRDASTSEVALALAECGRLVKGYGATRHRTTTHLLGILDVVSTRPSISATNIHTLQQAAMSPEADGVFSKVLAELPAA